eukprot:jgi/Hompol1/6626/HPOL_002897-RA
MRAAASQLYRSALPIIAMVPIPADPNNAHDSIDSFDSIDLIDTILDGLWLVAQQGDPLIAAVLLHAVDALLSLITAHKHQLSQEDLLSAETAICLVAASVGHLPAVKLLAPNILSQPDPSVLTIAFNIALKHSHKDITQYFLSLNNPKIISLSSAIQSGNLALVQQIHSQFPQSLTELETCTDSNLLLDPIRHNQLDTLWWLLDQYLNHEAPVRALLYNIKDLAAAFGRSEILHYAELHHIGNPISTDAMDLAAEYGQMTSLRWLNEHRDEGCTIRAMNRAARNGFLDVVVYLHAHRGEGATTRAIDLAATHGHLEIVKTLNMHRSEGGTGDAFRHSGFNGHLEVFRYLWTEYQAGRPRVEDLVGIAREGHVWIVEFLLESANTSRGYDLDIVNGFLVAALEGGHVGLAEILVSRFGAMPQPSMMENIAANGHLECAKWLHRHIQAEIPPQSLDFACQNGHIAMIEYLIDDCGIRITSKSRTRAHLSAVKLLFARDDRPWRVVAEWKWPDAPENDVCGICRNNFESCCGKRCKMPGDGCPLVFGECSHVFHLHCIEEW